MRRLLLVLLALTIGAVAAGPAHAEIVQRQDDQGRSITFDVQAPNVDVDWYANLLRGSLHGNEIERVTVRIVEPSAIRFECGPGAAACYGPTRGGARIIVPNGRSLGLASTVLHEYGHHIDANRGVPGVSEPNGTQSWWNARGMNELVNNGSVARNYRLGWDRAIGEIFAEDYAQVHLTQTPYAIRWLSPPDTTIQNAIIADLGGTPPSLDPSVPTTTPTTAPPTSNPTTRPPLVVTDRGVLSPSERTALPFGLLGPGRKVEVVVRATGASQAGARLRVDVVCGNRMVATKRLKNGARSVSITKVNLGPAECRVQLRSTSKQSLSYVLGLRLSIPAPPAT